MNDAGSGDDPAARVGPVVDAHVHFWDPTELQCPWLAGVLALDRPFGPADYSEASGWAADDRLVFVEANCRRSDNVRSRGSRASSRTPT
jgi:predicted TIM-barrel fold metal-dependent hydrolase